MLKALTGAIFLSSSEALNFQSKGDDLTMIEIFPAKRIITMDQGNPHADAVAVLDGRILGAGSLEAMKSLGPHRVNDQFIDQVLMPGFVEGHCHVSEGAFWAYTYTGFFPRSDPQGNLWQGCPSLEAVVDRLKQADLSKQVISAWGFDPIYFKDQSRMTRHDLDRVSTTLCVGVMHASGHIMNVNTLALDRAGLMRKGIEHPGIVLDHEGLPSGELRGPDAMTMVGRFVGFDREAMAGDEAAMWRFASLCVRAGVTTATDLANLLPDDAVNMMLRVTASDRYPVRIVAMRRFQAISPAALIERALELKAKSSDRLRLGAIKAFADGSIQGFSARLRWPGYYNGMPNGLWYTAPEQLTALYEGALANGLQVHTHTNGDEAIDLALRCLEQALRKQAASDHRFVLQHCQMGDEAQFRKMKALGMAVNLFPNHHFYWGDQHRSITLGPHRAARMNACASALRAGLMMGIHSDAPVTPLGPLFTAWAAVNRLTASGVVLGQTECIGVDEALYAITLGAAQTLHLDQEVGSIAVGKHADFVVLDQDPYEIPAKDLNQLSVCATVQAGRVFASA